MGRAGPIYPQLQLQMAVLSSIRRSSTIKIPQQVNGTIKVKGVEEMVALNDNG